MARRLIVSCGTSQIDKNEQVLRTIGIPTKAIDEIEEKKNSTAQIWDRTVNDWISDDIVQNFVQKLAAKHASLASDIGEKKNPFGAEISTLYNLTMSH